MNKDETYNRMVECGERSFFAEETKKLIQQDWRIPGSWGATKWTRIPSKDYPNEDMGLVFFVSGCKLQGLVLVTLDFMDTYVVRYFERSLTKKGGADLTERTNLQQDDVYFDQLVQLIDETVETTVETIRNN